MASRPFPYAGYSEDVDKRVRVLFNGKFVVDAKKAKLVYVEMEPDDDDLLMIWSIHTNSIQLGTRILSDLLLPETRCPPGVS